MTREISRGVERHSIRGTDREVGTEYNVKDDRTKSVII